MSDEASRQGTERLLLETQSASWEDRADAGRRLAPLAGDEMVDAALVRLLLDPEDTAVTYETAVALLQAHATSGIRVLARAFAVAGNDSTGDWLVDSLYSRMETPAERQSLLEAFGALMDDVDNDVRSGAAGVVDWLRA